METMHLNDIFGSLRNCPVGWTAYGFTNFMPPGIANPVCTTGIPEKVAAHPAAIGHRTTLYNSVVIWKNVLDCLESEAQ